MRTTGKVRVTTALPFTTTPTENVVSICDSSLTSWPLTTTSHSVETEGKYRLDGHHNVALKRFQDGFTDSHTSEIKR